MSFDRQLQGLQDQEDRVVDRRAGAMAEGELGGVEPRHRIAEQIADGEQVFGRTRHVGSLGRRQTRRTQRDPA